jgi:hypothetical protein
MDWFSLDEPSRIPEFTIHKYGTGNGSDLDGDRVVI